MLLPELLCLLFPAPQLLLRLLLLPVLPDPHPDSLNRFPPVLRFLPLFPPRQIFLSILSVQTVLPPTLLPPKLPVLRSLLLSLPPPLPAQKAPRPLLEPRQATR